MGGGSPTGKGRGIVASSVWGDKRGVAGVVYPDNKKKKGKLHREEVHKEALLPGIAERGGAGKRKTTKGIKSLFPFGKGPNYQTEASFSVDRNRRYFKKALSDGEEIIEKNGMSS